MSAEVCRGCVQAELGLSDVEEVEDWLVKAMGKKLMGGQMDQVLLVDSRTEKRGMLQCSHMVCNWRR